MNSKKAITLLVLASMILALVPVFPVQALAVPTLSAPNGVKGDTIVVTGIAGDVPAGTAIEVYWDDVTVAWNGVKGRLNSTTADPDGNYEIWFDVPESKNGNHYVWIKAVSTGETKVAAAFAVLPKISVSSTSGLAADKPTVDAYGLGSEKDVAILFVSQALGGMGALAGTVVAPAASGNTGDGVETDFEGTVGNAPIVPGTLVIANGIVEAFADNGDGTLTGSAGGTGTVNYVTGDWDVTFNAAPLAAVVITEGYSWFAQVANTYYRLGTGTTTTLGSYTKKVTVPGAIAGVYNIFAMDNKNNTVKKKFTIGPVITITPDAAEVGGIVTMRGRGFTALSNIPAGGVTIDGNGIGAPIVCRIDSAPSAINALGEFRLDFIVPQVPEVEEDYTITVTSAAVDVATADLEVTLLASIAIDPEYGPQGASVAISGEGFSNEKELDVEIELWNAVPAQVGADIKTIETKADGTFTGTFRIPAAVDGDYTIKAHIPADNIDANASIRVGTILVLLSDSEGPTGMNIVISGNGFTAGGQWNATFGGEELFADTNDNGADGVLDDGTGAPATFFVPQVAAGDYDIMVTDVDSDIEVVVSFTVTDVTQVEFTPASAPNKYNVSFTGMYFPEQVGALDVWLFNSTNEWQMNVLQGLPGAAAATNADGEVEAWWSVPGVGTLELGDYTVNITDATGDYFLQVPFTVSANRTYAAPRKATFRIGDIVTFKVEHSFGNVAPINGGDIMIYTPDGDLYWDGDGLWTWTDVDTWYVLPVSSQTAGGNQMVLLDDAPLGTWTWEWRDAAGDAIEDGSFMVESSADDVVSGQVTDLANQIDELTADLSGVTEDFDDVKSDISGVLAVAQQAVAAANAATEAVNAVATQANNAGAAAEAAQVAAENAAEAASGLTTLVYGAIGAALVAALAAIVSLMQISRRIAG